MADIVNPELLKMRQEVGEREQIYFSMLKEKAGANLYLFNKWILQAEKGDDMFVPLGGFHKNLCNFVQDRFDKRKLVLIPRSHLKTKLISVGYPTMKICNNQKIRVLIYSATWQMAVDIHMNIQKNLQSNENILKIYGDLTKDAPVWSQDRTKLTANDKREPTITAAGINNNLVGGHYDLIIMDDVVNRDNIATMDQIQKVITCYKDALDLLEPHGELIIIGTRWHDSDLYGWILDARNNALENYLTMIMRAYEGNLMTGEDFDPLWPAKFSQPALLSKLKEEGWAHFSSQYLNDPVPEEDAIFKRQWFHYYQQDDIKGSLLNKFLLIDPAISESKYADYTAMVVVGVDEWENFFILDIVRQRFSPHQMIEEIFRLREKWNVVDIAMEQVAFQRVLGYTIREDQRFKRRPFHITELKPNERTKDQRIKGLQPLYENGKIFHNKQLANNIYLEDELVRFPRSTHDDIIDSFAYSLDVVYPARQAKKARSGRQRYLYS
jgi:predicted phage terminase large subunit-like protein